MLGADGGSLAMESLAREAGVGVGTLYRHFPNREALIEAIYAAELHDLTASAAELLDLIADAVRVPALRHSDGASAPD
jgi:AcrR family transcriptional regulator